jgi:hypothetical protein
LFNPVTDRLVGGEAVKQTIAARAVQRVLPQPPRDEWEEFHDLEASSSRRPWRCWWRSIAAIGKDAAH